MRKSRIRKALLYDYAEKEYDNIPTRDDEINSFSAEYWQKRSSVIQGSNQTAPKGKRVAALIVSLLLLCSGITAHAFWDDIYGFFLEIKDRYLTISSESAESISHISTQDECPVQEIPERFFLRGMDALNQIQIYTYESSDGDRLSVTVNQAAHDTDLDSESDYELLNISGYEAFYSFKAKYSESTIYCLYEGDTSLTITGNVTKEEAVQMLKSALNMYESKPS